MLRVYACIAHEHDLRLVAVAGIICYLAALTALAAFEQARRARSSRPFWVGLASLVAAFGIWATHFLAMLAYQPHLPIGYDLRTTILSIVVAVIFTSAGWTLGLSPRRAAAPAAGALIGAGITVMHYVGMAAFVVAGHLIWDMPLVAASAIAGIGLGAAALTLQRRRARPTPWAAAALLTLAICAMHFTGMSAAAIYPDARIAVPVASIDTTTLAIIVTAATLLIQLSAFGLVLFDRGLARAQLCEARERADLADEMMKGAAERDALTEELKRQAGISSAALNHMAQGLSMYDAEDRLVISNPRYAELYGIPDELRAEGTPFALILDHLLASGTFPGTREDHSVHARRPVTEASQRDVALGNGRTVSIQVRPLPGGGWLATHEDVTEKRQAASRIAYLAAHDVLTGLPNRVTFGERLKAAAAAARRGRGFALHTLDLDRFKEVNDTLGHPVGDEILKQAATRLQALLREEDVVTRLGGDEFAVLQAEVPAPIDAAALAGRMVDALAEPFQFDGHTIAIGASIGISLAPDDGSDADELLQMSDLALYRAKADSRGSFRFFEIGMDSRLRARRDLESDLRSAIQDGQFEVHYQPLLELRTGRIDGFEALVRWRHPMRGLVQPAEFIAIAEESGLIIPIGEWVLRQACRDAASWPRDVSVAVNLSAAQFKRGDLLAMTTSALAAAGLAPQRLELEITESVLLHDEAWVRSILEKLTAFGVRIAMDDFGTGYSSLSYLRTFPFSKIKIDRSFVADLVGTTDARAIVQATIQLSEKLGMETTAEGVETAEQMEILAGEGCKQVQGFHVSRPVPLGEVGALLSRYNGTAGDELRAAS